MDEPMCTYELHASLHAREQTAYIYGHKKKKEPKLKDQMDME